MLLGLNTATPHLALALVEDGALVAELGRDVGSEHSEAVFVLLETLFAWSGRRRDELRGVGVAVGPGGFTGVRTGLAVAKTIAQVLAIPVYGVETLAALAWQYPGAPLVCPLLDARRGLVFAGLYRPGPEGPTALVEPALHPFEAWRDALLARPDASELLWVGEGAERHREEIEEAGRLQALKPQALPSAGTSPSLGVAGRGWRVPPMAQMAAGATSVALLAAKRLAAGEPSDGAALAPRYLREPQAVVNWEAARQASREG